MLVDIVKKLPKDVELSEHLKSQAECYIEIMHFGVRYYVPVTKEFKKIFKIRKRKGYYYFEDYKLGSNMRAMLQDIISGVYLQIRDSIGAELHQQLSSEIKSGFAKMFDGFLGKKIETGLNNKLLIEQKPKPPRK